MAAARPCFRASAAPITIAAVVSLCMVPVGLLAQTPKPSEYQVKAAYIYNFGKFVKWPANVAANQNDSFTICVLDDDPFGSVLQSTLTGQFIGGRPVTVRHIPKPQEAIGCRILFIKADEEGHLKGILAALGEASVLTVSDISDFSNRGGMIQFVLEGDRVRFEINRASAEGAGLTLTSDLLKVAVAVKGASRTGDQ
jgi:hypothetical protein